MSILNRSFTIPFRNEFVLKLNDQRNMISTLVVTWCLLVHRFIYVEDLMRFMREDEAFRTMATFEGAIEMRRISKSSLKNWMVSIYISPLLIFIIVFIFHIFVHESLNRRYKRTTPLIQTHPFNL